MLKVLLVDDEKPARDRMAKLLRLESDVEVIGEAVDGIEALEKTQELRPDLLFLDIEMPELNGLEVAKSIDDNGPLIVFVTAYNEFAIEAFEAAAVDYLVKPVVPARLSQALKKVARFRGGSHSQDISKATEKVNRIAVRVGQKFEVLDLDSVVTVQARDKYTVVLSGGKEYYVEESLERFESRLSENFLRVHRSAIVNTQYIKELRRLGDRKYVAIVDSDQATEIAISRERLSDVKEKLKVI